MAEGLATVFMPATLRRGKHETAILNCAGTLQYVPMRFTGLPGEGGRRRQEGGAGFRQRPIKRRETQVIANRQAKPAPGQIGHHAEIARAEVARFAITLAVSQIDIEHVDLVITRGDLALRVDQEGTI